LVKLGVETIDFYLLHAFNKGTWENTIKFNGISACEKLKKAGKIRHFGYSFHDAPEVFTEIEMAYKWEFCQVIYNYLDRDEQAGLKGIALSKSRGTDVIVMEPIRGGKLVAPLPDKVMEAWKSAAIQKAPVEWALEWIWDNKDISLVLSGMSTMAQVEENLKIAALARAGAFTPEMHAIVDKVTTIYRDNLISRCTDCRYCVPCPQGVDIPRNFRVWNEFHKFAGNRGAVDEYHGAVPDKDKADKCTECAECVPKCPQLIDIPADLKKVVADLAR
jgi:predicted aldo/keto reductase-like oxidoreductase